MNKVHLLLVLAGALFIARMAVSQDTAPSTTTPNDDLALLKEDVRSQKKQIVAANSETHGRRGREVLAHLRSIQCRVGESK